jgi:hypothetical protein
MDPTRCYFFIKIDRNRLQLPTYPLYEKARTYGFLLKLQDFIYKVLFTHGYTWQNFWFNTFHYTCVLANLVSTVRAVTNGQGKITQNR